VVYAFALPRQATLRRFYISGNGFKVASELRSRQEAGKEYEDGIAQGSLASLATIYRDGVTNLSVGNIRPNEKVVVLLEILAGVELHDDGLRFRFPLTLVLSRLPITPMPVSSNRSRDLAKWNCRRMSSAT
jgi:hypothetical protein